jgi:malonate transporter and related proteins
VRRPPSARRGRLLYRKAIFVGGVISGILIVAAVIAVGYLAARFGILGPEVQGALTRTAFYITNPALLYTVVAGSDIRAALGTDAPLALLSAAAVGLLYWLLSFLFFRRPAAETAVGAMASSYANANNIGIPVSLYAVGTAQHVAPVLLVQLLVLAPTYLTILGLVSGARISWNRMLLQPLSNPMIIASGLGAVVALTGWQEPDLLQKPIDMLAGGAVPMVLLAFGLSLAGRAPLQKDDGRTETLVATFLKIAGMPAVVWLLGRFVFGLEGKHLLAIVIMAALPTAQNVFLFASPYGRGMTVARDVILCTTVLCSGALLVIAWAAG